MHSGNLTAIISAHPQRIMWTSPIAALRQALIILAATNDLTGVSKIVVDFRSWLDSLDGTDVTVPINKGRPMPAVDKRQKDLALLQRELKFRSEMKAAFERHEKERQVAAKRLRDAQRKTTAQKAADQRLRSRESYHQRVRSDVDLQLDKDGVSKHGCSCTNCCFCPDCPPDKWSEGRAAGEALMTRFHASTNMRLTCTDSQTRNIAYGSLFKYVK